MIDSNNWGCATSRAFRAVACRTIMPVGPVRGLRRLLRGRGAVSFQDARSRRSTADFIV